MSGAGERGAGADPSGGAAGPRVPPALTAVDRLLLGQDAPAHPMVIRVRFRWDGPLDASLVGEAADRATARHPMLRAVTDGRSWTPTDAPRPPAAPAGDVPFLDVGSAPGLRVSHHGAFTDFDFHHACCDGQGARQWLVDWLVISDALARGVAPDPPRLDASRLALRGDLSHPPGVEPIGGAEGLANLRLTTRGRTARLRGRHAPRLDTVELPPGETAAARAAVKAAGLTLNDAGVLAAFAALMECGDDPALPRLSGGRLTVLNPVDLRRPADLRMPAAGKVGFAYLRRTRAECGAGLRASVLEQLRYVKDRYAGAEFVRGFAAIEGVPGAVRLLRLLGKFVPTCQFTCLGDATRGRRLGFRRNGAGDVLVGEARLASIAGFAPPGPGVPLSLSACETATSLTLTAWHTLGDGGAALLKRFAVSTASPPGGGG